MKVSKIENGFKISPNFYAVDWNNLDLSKNNVEEWNKAIEIFKDRIEGRYLKQIEVLDKNTERLIGLFSGFAIMSLTCLLIETLEQFWTGNIQTSRKSRIIKNSCFIGFYNFFSKNKKKQIINDSLTFYSFFQRSDKFKTFFDTHEKAEIFYTKIRCGLLHQGQTKGKSLIHIRTNEPIMAWIDNNNPAEGLSINRRLFVEEVRIVYEKYILALQNPHDLNFKRQTLERKMKYIVEQK